ncbi:MAG: hypothetical protein SGBAC_012416 [Bacillariaceae sp.]
MVWNVSLLLQQREPPFREAILRETLGSRYTQMLTQVPSIAKKGMPRVASIMDLAGVLDPNEVPEITQVVEEAQRKTQSEIQIVIVDKVQKGYTPKRMSTTLFNEWELGTAQKNNGVLILVVLDQRRTEIEVGKALDSAMNAEWCQRTLQETASPAFRQERYTQGVLKAVQAVSQRLQEVDSGLIVTKNQPNFGSDLFDTIERVQTYLCLSLFLFVFGWSAYESSYPIKVNFPSCDAGKDTWKFDYNEEEGGGWVTTLEATDERDGAKELKGTCANCGHVYTQTDYIRKYDGSTVDSDGNTMYYYNSDSRSDSESGR